MQMNLPNKLTTMRVILIPVFLLVLFLMDEPMNRYIATAIFIVASLTDFLDGHIARKYNLVSNFGKFMDPLADKLLVMSALVSMVAMEDLPAWVVIVILAREFAITGFRTLAMEANIVMAASWWGKIKTTTQMIMIILVLLHLPLPAEMPPTKEFLPLLPPGLRAFALYVQAHYLYLKEEYARSAGVVEATLAMGASAYPISAIYLHLVAVMDYMSMKQPDRAQTHLLAAWEIARPDDLIEGFGEHHGLLGAMLEATIKPNWPEDFKRIIDITYRFSSGWRRVHNPITGHDVADDLTTTEFAMAMLAARSWTNQEIAEYLNISINTVKSHISEAMKKLNVENRKDLKQYMLR